jgi:hypothetical protein
MNKTTFVKKLYQTVDNNSMEDLSDFGYFCSNNFLSALVSLLTTN